MKCLECESTEIYKNARCLSCYNIFAQQKPHKIIKTTKIYNRNTECKTEINNRKRTQNYLESFDLDNRTRENYERAEVKTTITGHCIEYVDEMGYDILDSRIEYTEEQIQQLYNAINKLTEKQKYIITGILDGKTYKQIANEMGNKSPTLVNGMLYGNQLNNGGIIRKLKRIILDSNNRIIKRGKTKITEEERQKRKAVDQRYMEKIGIEEYRRRKREHYYKNKAYLLEMKKKYKNKKEQQLRQQCDVKTPQIESQPV